MPIFRVRALDECPAELTLTQVYVCGFRVAGPGSRLLLASVCSYFLGVVAYLIIGRLGVDFELPR